MPDVKIRIPGTPGEYPVMIESGLISRIPPCLKPFEGRKIAVITDEHVAPLYAGQITAAIEAAGAQPFLRILPAGETTKCMEQLAEIYDFFLDSGITRIDALLALGGGVIGDLTGYAAATYLRGVRFIQFPTTLLAQVDSSVGGKVAVNHPRGKNLLGAFYQPELVLIDTDTLRTLDQRQVGAGLGEVIKYGCILDAGLFRQIEACGSRENLAPHYPEIVARCIELKGQVVFEDPYDRGLRMILNFGHTLAHAIENAAGYGQVLHGEAVCIGMVAAATWGTRLGITPADTEARIREVLTAYALPTEVPAGLTAEKLFPSLALDKKSIGKDIRVVCLEEIGRARTVPVPAAKLKAFMEQSS